MASLATAAAIVLVPILVGVVGMTALVRQPCADGGDTPANYNLQYADITIPSRYGGAYQGYYVPGNGERAATTIIVPAAYSGGRGGMLYEAAPLAAAGYNVVMFESRACGGNRATNGALSLGYRDSEDIEDVIRYLQTNGQSTPKMALHGFSSAGAASIMAAAKLPQVSAVLAEGGYHNLNEIMGMGRTPANVLQALMMFGIRIAYRLNTGDDSSVLDPLHAINRIPPRPILLVYGSKEITLPGAQEQLTAAKAAVNGAMAELWIVPGADHGGYISAVGLDEYLRQVTAFYDCALLDRCDAWRKNWK